MLNTIKKTVKKAGSDTSKKSPSWQPTSEHWQTRDQIKLSPNSLYIMATVNRQCPVPLLFFYQTMHPADRGGRMELPGLPGGLYTVFATDDDQGFGEVFNRVKFETRDHPFDVGENGRNPSLRGDSSFRVVAILKVGDLPSTKALCGALDKANKPYNGMSMLNLVAPRLQQAMAQKFPARGDPRPLIIQTTLSLLRQAEGLDVTQTIPSEKSESLARKACYWVGYGQANAKPGQTLVVDNRDWIKV